MTKKLLKIFAFAASACVAFASGELYDMLVQLENAESLIGQKQTAQAGETLLGQSRFARATDAFLSQKDLAQTADWGGAMLVFKIENLAGAPFWRWRSYVGEYTYAFYVLRDYENADNWQKIKLFPEIKELSE